jgi:hypothetical protein
MKIIEIGGIGIPNKGAELMLVAILKHFESRREEYVFVSEPYTPYIYRAKYGLYQKGTLRFKNINLSFLFSLIPKKIRRKFGIILDSEIDHYLDASGFAYGDQWGVSKLRNRLTNNLARWKRSGRNVILLPQAFGPFNDGKFKREITKLIEKVDLIYARDSESLRYLTETADLTPSKKCQLLQSPDFTCSVDGLPKPGKIYKSYDICLVPNHKMLSMRDDGNSYMESLIKLCKDCQKKGFSVLILVHEGKQDLEIAECIRVGSGTNVDIFQSDDPLELKYAISRSRILVGSRFHSLVSSLAQGVPVIAAGWSHKYSELMKDYGVSEYLVEDFADIPTLVERLFDEKNYSLVRDVLRVNAQKQKELVNQMWNEVDKIIFG